MKNNILLILALVLLSGCGNINSLTSESSSKVEFNFSIYDFGNITNNDEIEFNPQGIYAVDKDTIFVFGAIERITNGAMRTFILRSIDGGRTWKEVSEPKKSYSIYHLAFLDDGYGWALGILHTNDIGNPVLWRSFDNGETWSEAISLNATGASFFPLGIKFSDKDNGNINFMDVMFVPSDSFGTLSTADGGLTWQETFSVIVPYDSDFKNSYYILEKLENEYSNVPGGYYGNHWWKPSSDEILHATGHDGSEWHLYHHEASKEFLLLSRNMQNSSWEVSATIPDTFVYKDGHIVKP